MAAHKLWNKKKNRLKESLDWFHPDRRGAQLRMLLPFLEAMFDEHAPYTRLCAAEAAEA